MLGANGGKVRILKILEDADPSIARAYSEQCQMLRFRKGRQILGQQDDTTDVFFVLDGTVHLVGYSASGKVVSFGDVGPDGIIGEFSAVDGLPRSASVTASSDCLLARMTAATFREMLAREPGIALKVLEAVITKTRLINERVFEFSTLSVDSRLHAELLRLAELSGVASEDADEVTVIAPAPTHQEIAMRISTHREAVTRELNRLATEGILDLGRRRIELRDPAALREILERARFQ